VDLGDVVDLSPSDLIKAMHPLNSALDARKLAYDTGMKAKELQSDVARLRMVQMGTAARLAPATTELDACLTRLQATDAELQDLRKEFQSLEPGRTVYSMNVAVWLSNIDSKRARIAEAVSR
jgi:hypothetical protein